VDEDGKTAVTFTIRAQTAPTDVQIPITFCLPESGEGPRASGAARSGSFGEIRRAQDGEE
jgi:hypothetical protein